MEIELEDVIMENDLDGLIDVEITPEYIVKARLLIIMYKGTPIMPVYI